MATDYLAVVTLNKRSMIPADAINNTFVFHFPDTPPASGDLDAMRDALILFYNAGHSGGNPINTWMSQSLSISTEVNEIKWYDLDGHLDGSPHGSPVRLDLWTLGNSADSSLPDEVAAVLTYQRAYGSDVEFAPGTRPRSRDRGRLYIGPLGVNAIGTDSGTHEVFLDPTFGAALEGAGLDLLAAGAGKWHQWSRANANTAPVTGGWVDDAFDSQRRRGNKPTARVLW